MAIMSGPGRFGQAAAAAFALTLIVMWAGSRRGIKVHSLEVFGAVVFAAFVALGIFGSPTLVTWLELWAGEITNGLLAAYALTTLAIRRPFTIAYARDTVDPAHWDSPLFIRVNYVLSAVWAGAFLINTAVGTLGDAVLHDGDNFWTGWIVQLAVTLIAVAITEFYPDYARAKFLASTGESEDTPPSFGKLLDWLPGFVIGIGIAGWVSDSFSAGVGIALIVVGIVAGAVVRKLFPDEKEETT
ncbi:membrane protein [Mycobacterium sp. EPa45]|nr:membrane protein [Mycobacterium sp. EPa45]